MNTSGTDPDAGPRPTHPWPGNLEPPDVVATTTTSTTTSSTASSRPFQSVGFRISTLGYAIARRFRQMLVPFELEPREFALLRAVASDEGRTQQAIGARLGIAPSRMVGFVDVLEARGLLERRLNADDRRTRALHLTDLGRDLLDRATAVAAAHERDLCADFTADERQQLLELLERVGLRLDLRPEHGHAALADE
jgi:DNA-binding MarR family transcriptional regulator